MLCHDIHRDLAKIHVRPDPGRRGDARRLENVLYQHPRKPVCIHVIDIKI